MQAIITITNASDATVFATVESARRIIELESDYEKLLRQEASGGGFTVGAKGASVGANGETSATSEEVRTIAKIYSVLHGPAAGFVSIAPGAKNEVAVPGESVSGFFLTLSDGERVIA